MIVHVCLVILSILNLADTKRESIGQDWDEDQDQEQD